MLHLAEAHGWQSQGTVPPRGIAPADWGGNYDSNDGQAFSTEDAAAFAAALQRALSNPHREETTQALADRISSMVREASGGDHQIQIGESYWTAVEELVRLFKKAPVAIE